MSEPRSDLADAFDGDIDLPETVGARPLGYVDYDTEEVSFRRDHAARGETDLDVAPALATDVPLVKFTPGMGPEAFERCSGADGVVVEGTGLGHVSTDCIPAIADLVEDGTPVVMTSQCLEGRVCDRVYDTGRDLLDAGVVEAEDTLPGTAKVKLMWALANTESVRETLRTSLAGELTHRSTPWA